MIVTDPDLLNKVSVWQQKSADGTITLEEMREAVKALRGNRMSAVQTASAAKKSAAKAPPRDAGSLLDELGKL